MDIPNFKNIGSNYVLSKSQADKLKGINSVKPAYDGTAMYVLKEGDFALNHNKMLGEGGLGSGKALEERFPNITAEEREKRINQQVMNAQRIYRSKNRATYNSDMLDMYYAMKKGDYINKSGENPNGSKKFAISQETGAKLPYDDPKGWYEYKQKQAKIANKKYRLKKRNLLLLANIDSVIKKDLKKKWIQENKKPKGRPKKNAVKPVFSPDTDWYKNEYKIMKADKEAELLKTGKIKSSLVEDPEFPYKVGDKIFDDYTVEQHMKNIENPKSVVKELRDAKKKPQKVKKVKPVKPSNMTTKELKDFIEKPSQNIKMNIKELDEENVFAPDEYEPEVKTNNKKIPMSEEEKALVIRFNKEDNKAYDTKMSKSKFNDLISGVPFQRWFKSIK